MRGKVRNDSNMRWWNPDPFPGTTPYKDKAGIFEKSDLRVLRVLHTKGCSFHPIEEQHKQENKTMNYLEAVKELVNNPKALEITFPRVDGATLRIKLNSEGRLSFWGKPGGENQVRASNPQFLLREDFSIEYKVEKTVYDRISEATGIPRAQVKKVIHCAAYQPEFGEELSALEKGTRIHKAAQAFFTAMNELYSKEK